MEFDRELRSRERKMIQERLHRTRIKCCILAVLVFLLMTALALVVMRKNQQRTAAAGGKTILEYTGTAGAGTDDTGASQDILILVNKDHPLSEDYQVQLHWLQNGSCAVSETMYDSLREMLTVGSEEGLEFVVASGYRSREYQEELLKEDIASSMESEGLTWQEAYDKETMETMPPGCSEHETGLAADIVSLGYQVLDGEQENTAENQWLQENCARFGFILRYPRGKEGVTGVSYESWHFRYVGTEAAGEITRKGITLEEYLEQI